MLRLWVIHLFNRCFVLLSRENVRQLLLFTYDPINKGKLTGEMEERNVRESYRHGGPSSQLVVGGD